MQNDAPFQYAPLAHPSQIRLVEVLPSTDPTDPIAVTLHTRSLEPSTGDEPLYVALSYAWGSPEDTVPIRVDGAVLEITRNLDLALRRFRAGRRDAQIFDDERRKALADAHGEEVEEADEAAGQHIDLLWVDAISINQADPVEKSAQVARMTRIFSSAACIMAWLGPSDPNARVELAIDKINQVIGVYDSVGGASAPEKARRWAMAMLSQELVSCDEDGDDDEESVWEAVQALFDHPWWSRIWIAQEASTPVPTTLVCGDTNAEAVDLDDALQFAVLVAMYEQQDEDAPSHRYPISPYAYTLDGLRSRRRNETVSGSETELLSTLMACRHHDAADPRDKVYGILGMVSPRSSSRLLPDYNKDLVSVYTDVVQYHLETGGYEGKLDFLGADGLPEGGITGLPSWLPDWRFQNRYHVPLRKFLPDEASTPRPGRRSESCVYSASGAAESVLELGLKIDTADVASIQGRILRARGYRVGYLYDVQPMFQPGDPGVFDTWREALRGGTESYFTGETEGDAFNRLIVADMRQDKRMDTGSEDANGAQPQQNGQSQQNGHKSEDISLEDMLVACSGRRLARVVQKDWSADGLALVPQCAREGDQVFVLLGGQVLYALRGASMGTYRFLGECYVHGLMDGELLDLLKTGMAELSDVLIR